MACDHNYFEFESSECPTEFSEETVLTSDTARFWLLQAASRPITTDRESVLTLVNSERQWNEDCLLIYLFRNVHFRSRGSIAILDTRDGIVIVAPISGIAQHYLEVDLKMKKILIYYTDYWFVDYV